MPDIINVDYSTKIPNNVDLAADRTVLRALEGWHPGYLDWWMEMGPNGFQDALVYLRTAVSVEAQSDAIERLEDDLAKVRTAATLGGGHEHLPVDCVHAAEVAAASDIAEAFRRYEERRVLRTSRVQVTARFYGDVYHATGVTAELRRELLSGRTPEQAWAGIAWLFNYEL